MLPAACRWSQSAPSDFLLPTFWPYPALSLSLAIHPGSSSPTGQNCVWAKACSRSILMATGTPSLQCKCVWDFSMHGGEPSPWMHWYQRALQVLGWYWSTWKVCWCGPRKCLNPVVSIVTDGFMWLCRILSQTQGSWISLKIIDTPRQVSHKHFQSVQANWGKTCGVA